VAAFESGTAGTATGFHLSSEGSFSFGFVYLFLFPRHASWVELCLFFSFLTVPVVGLQLTKFNDAISKVVVLIPYTCRLEIAASITRE
jgi:hypothetical protein